MSAISAARNINRELSARLGKKRTGQVFADRYHARILKTPRQVRNTIAYVLNNWRHHGEDKLETAKTWVLDPFASSVAFTDWKERDEVGYSYRAPPGYRGFVVWQPSLWLLREGWKRWGLISADVSSGSGRRIARDRFRRGSDLQNALDYFAECQRQRP